MITPSAPLARWKTRGYVCVGGMDRRSFVNEWLDIDLGAGAHACGSFVDPERGYDKSRYVLASTIESWLDYPLCVLVTRDQNVRSGYIVPPTIYSNIVCAHSQLTVADGRLSTFTVPGSGHGEYDAIDIRCAYGLLEIYEREVAAATKLYTSADLDRTDRTDEDLRVMLDDDVGRARYFSTRRRRRDDGIDVLHRRPDRTPFDAPPRGVGQAARRRARARYRRGRVRARD